MIFRTASHELKNTCYRAKCDIENMILGIGEYRDYVKPICLKCKEITEQLGDRD